jgi:hypothetical protein
MTDAPDLTVLLNAIRERPDDGHRWLALSVWLWDNDRDDEAAAVQEFWPTLRDNVIVSGVSLHATLRQMARHAKVLGRRARRFERRLDEPEDDEPPDTRLGPYGNRLKARISAGS